MRMLDYSTLNINELQYVFQYIIIPILPEFKLVSTNDTKITFSKKKNVL